MSYYHSEGSVIVKNEADLDKVLLNIKSQINALEKNDNDFLTTYKT